MRLDYTAASSTVISDYYFDTNTRLIGHKLLPFTASSTSAVYGQAAGPVTLNIEITGVNLKYNKFSQELSGGTITGIRFFSDTQPELAEITEANWDVVEFNTALNAAESQRDFTPLVDFLASEPVVIVALQSSQSLEMDDSPLFAAGISNDMVITGSDFGDHLVGGSFTDQIKGEKGDDTILSGGGDDGLFGDSGNDILYAGAGNDLADGGAGDDRIFGGKGIDTMFGSNGKDKLFGGGGADEIWGEAGRDVLKGNKGADALYGGAKKDVLKGGDGRDILDGGKGNDKLTGGAGRDVFEFSKNYNVDQITDFKTGADVLSLDKSLWAGATLTEMQVVSAYARDTGNDVIFDFGNGDEITLTGVSSLTGLENDLLIV